MTTEVTRNPGVRRSARHAWRRSRPESCDGREALRVIEAVFRDADVAEAASRRALGVVRREPLRAQALDFELEVRADLVLEVALGAAAEHQAFSGVGPGSMTRAMESTRRFQRPASTVSCLRPAVVRV